MVSKHKKILGIIFTGLLLSYSTPLIVSAGETDLIIPALKSDNTGIIIIITIICLLAVLFGIYLFYKFKKRKTRY